MRSGKWFRANTTRRSAPKKSRLSPAWYEGRPLNYSPENIPRTQTIEPVYIETSAFFIFPRALWTGRHRRIGDRPYMAVVDRIEGLDIDYPEDFTMAEIIAASRNLPK